MITQDRITLIKRIGVLVLLILLLGVPGIHKLLGDIPPEWFQKKFAGSLIDAFPGSLSFSYILIIVLEVVGPVLFLVGAIRLEFLPDRQIKFIQYGFLVCYLLFLILTFGSFLVEDYGNGFNDFMYFVGVMLLEHLLFQNSSLRGETKRAD